MGDRESSVDSARAALNVDLSGCASAWDDDRALRQQLRKNGSIFSPLPGKEKVEPSVDAAGLNADALLPVVKRLTGENLGDQIGMVSIPSIETELPVSHFPFSLSPFNTFWNQSFPFSFFPF